MGFCTAPSRDSAATSTSDSSQVGSIHETTVSDSTPRAASPAAARNAAARYSAKLSSRPFSSLAKRAASLLTRPGIAFGSSSAMGVRLARAASRAGMAA